MVVWWGLHENLSTKGPTDLPELCVSPKLCVVLVPLPTAMQHRTCVHPSLLSITKSLWEVFALVRKPRDMLGSLRSQLESGFFVTRSRYPNISQNSTPYYDYAWEYIQSGINTLVNSSLDEILVRRGHKKKNGTSPLIYPSPASSTSNGNYGALITIFVWEYIQSKIDFGLNSALDELRGLGSLSPTENDNPLPTFIPRPASHDN